MKDQRFFWRGPPTAASVMAVPIPFTTGNALVCTIYWINNCIGGFPEGELTF